MAEWFGLFSSTPRCRCGVEIPPAEEAAYTRLTSHGPVLMCEDCWAERHKAVKSRSTNNGRLHVCRPSSNRGS